MGLEIENPRSKESALIDFPLNFPQNLSLFSLSGGDMQMLGHGCCLYSWKHMWVWPCM